MRLSKTAWLILSAGVFIIALALLLMLYTQQASDEEQMEESLAEANALLPQLIAEREDWQSQLTQLENLLLEELSALETSIAKFPEAVESIEYDEELFMIAYDCDLEIVSLTALEPRDEEVDIIIPTAPEASEEEAELVITYAVTSFEVQVSPATAPPDSTDAFEAYLDDAIANILNFIDTVANGEYFTNATVEEIIWEFPEITEAERPVATIKLLIYGYESEFYGYEGE